MTIVWKDISKRITHSALSSGILVRGTKLGLCSCLMLLFLMSHSLMSQTLTVTEGAKLTLHGDISASVSNLNVAVDGLLNQKSGSLRFETELEKSRIEGSGNLSFQDLELASLDKVDLYADIEIKGDLVMNAGNLNIHDHFIYLSTNESKIVNESSESRVTSSANGEIVKSTTSAILQNENVGNLGLIFDKFSNQGSLEIRRGHKTVDVPFGQSITRYYKVNTQKKPEEEIKLDLKYFEDEVLINASNLDKTIWVKNNGKWDSKQTESKYLMNENQYVAEAQLEIFESIITVGLYKKLIDQTRIPTAFTPNGDKVNDTFIIPGIEKLRNAEVRIYSQSGTLLYQSSDYENHPWDGTARGSSLPFATYHYVIQDLKNPLEKIEGEVSIIQ